ncbi:MAG: iron-containing alcohol dehydrogenase [Clostridiales Family XIII bacterium]|jgi:alcohol dehydrogenase class IV|nr:iron-containing alcohol dehydrogenase [Clostridiales Family XIII bacterium]
MISTFLASRNPILFGRGASKRVGEELRALGCKKALVVFDKGVKAAGIVDGILDAIHEAGIETVCYDGVLPDPPDYTVEEAAAIGRAANADGVVAVGGGSSLDTGKGAKVLLTNPPPISNYYLAHEDIRPDTGAMKPIIVIPTTAGTGSEATPGGIITDTKNKRKQNVPCATDLGIVDPELTIGLPRAVTVTTAADALCHAVEAFTSAESNAISDVLAERAIALIGANLTRAVQNGADAEAREGLHLAATLAGLSIMGPFCNVPHEIGLTLGMLFRMPHGTACAMTLPEALRFLSPASPARVAKVARLLGAELPGDAPAETIGAVAHETVATLYRTVGFPKFSEFVKSKDDVLASVPAIMEAMPFHFSPRPVTAADVSAILAEAYDR